MDHLSAFQSFAQTAETGSFVAAGRQLGMSASAVGKAVARLEDQLQVRLFHRNTRKMALTAEGCLLLARCQRIFAEVDAARAELAQATVTPRGTLRVSLPLVAMLLSPILADFMTAYPDIRLDLDFSDRLVDVIEEGFDAVVRTGQPSDSRLMSRTLGHFRLKIVAAPAYLDRHGTPLTPADLADHHCLRGRSPTSGKVRPWPFAQDAAGRIIVPETLVATAVDPLIHLALSGHGIACLPPFAVRDEIADGRLVSLLEAHIMETEKISLLWPAARNETPRLRVLVDFMAANLRLD